jgi:hypothetical protein
MTRSAPTPAPIAVATFVILFPSCPSFTPGYTSFLFSRLWAWLRQLGDIRCTQAECGFRATLYANRPNFHQSQGIGFPHFLKLP